VDGALDSGAAAERFARMVCALGGPADFLERCDDYLPQAPVIAPVRLPAAGYLSAVDTRAIGNAVIELGGGRRALDDVLDLSVGYTGILPVGSRVARGQPVAMVHAASREAAATAAKRYAAACSIGESPPQERQVVYRRLLPSPA
ncbi:MAG TPA: hypothetical protein VFE85_05240, partial [Woeseiaceae bacterium]|nr:hypothetical protein [Woeseiaceae bacterium]